MDDESEYEVFDFDDRCSVDFIADTISAYNTSTISLDLKPFLAPLSTLFSVLRSVYL